jgi:hypothetical protein
LSTHYHSDQYSDHIRCLEKDDKKRAQPIEEVVQKRDNILSEMNSRRDVAREQLEAEKGHPLHMYDSRIYDRAVAMRLDDVSKNTCCNWHRAPHRVLQQVATIRGIPASKSPGELEK